MPSSSMRLTSVASVKRGGGCGEVLLGLDAVVLERVALRPSAAGGGVVVLAWSSSPLPLRARGRRGLPRRPEEAVELHDRAGGAQAVGLAVAARTAMSAVVCSSSADAIWLATVRFQISS